MDDELRALQEQFFAAQEKKSSVRLSDRNIVELILKLQQLGLLETSLLHSTNGKEYITQEFLRNEIKREISNSGRISLVDLASSLGVDLFYCEREIESIVSTDNSIALFQGEVITESYWDSVAEEIEEILLESGQISMGELARQFNVGSDVLVPAIKSRIGSTIHGMLENGQLYTSAYLSRIKSMVRGVVRGASMSTPLSSLWNLLQKLEAKGSAMGMGTVTDATLLSSLLSQLIDEGEVSGSMKSSSSVWTPSVFSSSQKQALESFYSQNRMISFEMLSQFSFSSPSQAQSNFPDAIALDSCFVHPSFLDQLDSAAEEVINGNSWCNLLSFVHSSLTTTDCIKLSKLCPSISKSMKDKSAFFISDTYLVTGVFFKSLREKFEQTILSLPSKRVRNSSSDHDLSSTRVQDSEWKKERKELDEEENRDGKSAMDEESKTQKGGKKANQVSKPEKKERMVSKSKAKSKSKEEEGEGEEEKEDKLFISKGKLRKKGMKGGEELLIRKEKMNANPPSSKSSKGLSKKDANSDMEEVFSEEEMKTFLLQWIPELEESDADEGGYESFLDGLILLLRPSLSQFWNQITQSSFSENTEKIRKIRSILQQKFDDLYISFQLHSKSISVFEQDSNSQAAIQKHILRTNAAQIVDLFFHFQSLENELSNTEGGMEEEGGGGEKEGRKKDSDKEISLTHVSFSQSERNAMLHSFPSPLRAHLSSLLIAIEGKSVDEFEKQMESFASESGLRVKKMDKKMERNLMFSSKKTLVEQIEKEENPIVCLPLILSLLFLQVYNRVLHVPGRLVSSVVNILKPKLGAEEAQILFKYHSITVKLLSETNNAPIFDSPLYDELQHMLIPLKKIVTPP